MSDFTPPPNNFTFAPDGKCPICGTPWADEHTGFCDHEAAWYREWLAQATALLEQNR